MKVLVLGVTGMLGHVVWSELANRGFETWGSTRRSCGEDSFFCMADELSAARTWRIIFGVEADSPLDIDRAIAIANPDAVVNCIGIVKQAKEAEDFEKLTAINALLPHRIASACSKKNIRFIHISTDCVFTGKTGCYQEDSPADARDGYGVTKFLGETALKDALVLRTSIVGRELSGAQGLFEWFLAQNQPVKGFRKAIFSGLTTLALTQVISSLLLGFPELRGLYNVSSSPINKYDLLNLVQAALGTDHLIIPTSDFKIDRSLDSTKFRMATGICVPEWSAMITAFAQHAVHYDEWRSNDK